MTDKPTLLEAALEAYGNAPIDTMASAQHNQEVFMQAAIDTIRAHDASSLAKANAFIDAILKQSPNGEDVMVKYHPNGDWTVYESKTLEQST